MTASNIVLLVFTVVLEVGGIMGYMKAGSKASLIASIIFGTPLFLVAVGVLPALVAEVVLGILLVFMAVKFAKSKKFMPSGVIAILSAVTLVARFLLK
jgi:uncharacterized membrane protein (UPF0136 family)